MKIQIILRILIPALLISATVARAESDEWKIHNLIEANKLLDGICRGSSDPESFDAKTACKTRQEIYAAIDSHNWCYGKIGQIGADMAWHKCVKNSQRPTQEDLHEYDF